MQAYLLFQDAVLMNKAKLPKADQSKKKIYIYVGFLYVYIYIEYI